MTKEILTQARLKELLHYDSETGIFTRLVRTSPRINIGDIAGCVITNHNGKKYLQIRVLGEIKMAHRLAWLYIHGNFPKKCIDHIDGDGCNNKINNLRDVTHNENMKNLKLYKCNKNGFTGVTRQDGKWRARTRIQGKEIFLGSYKTHLAACYSKHQSNLKYDFHENHGKSRNL